MRRLVILACSARKSDAPQPVPAIDRYDGPMWRILRNFLRDEPLFARALDIWALSAQFGLVPACEFIPPYEQKMTADRAQELRPCVQARLQTVLDNSYDDICLALSSQYMAALEGWEELLPSGVRVTRTDGPMGIKLSRLKAWLRREEWTEKDMLPQRLEAVPNAPGRAQVAGVLVEMTKEDVLRIARERLQASAPHSKAYRDWYVVIDGRRVAPKWLVGIITGLPTSRFNAADARRVILKLGLDIERVAR